MYRHTFRALVLGVLVLTACDGSGDSEAHPWPEGRPHVPEPVLPEGAQAVSLLGDTLYPPPLPADVQADREARYLAAEKALEASPDDVDALIWMGRRAAYLGRYTNAIDTYTHALTLYPDDARLYRHRGHRYLTLRKLDRAIQDLRRAAELTEGTPDQVEPDGIPNAQGIPTSTLQFNIWYHLGLAYYLKGDFEAAAYAYDRSAKVSVHPDSKVATAYWQYLTLRRLGRVAEAGHVLDGISRNMGIIESAQYLDVLLLFKGVRSLDDILGSQGSEATLESTTTGYGVGAWYYLQGNIEAARRTWKNVLAGRSQWAAFGYIAAEAELADPTRR